MSLVWSHPLLDLRGIASDPTNDRAWMDADTPLGHHFSQIAIADDPSRHDLEPHPSAIGRSCWYLPTVDVVALAGGLLKARTVIFRYLSPPQMDQTFALEAPKDITD